MLCGKSRALEVSKCGRSQAAACFSKSCPTPAGLEFHHEFTRAVLSTVTVSFNYAQSVLCLPTAQGVSFI